MQKAQGQGREGRKEEEPQMKATIDGITYEGTEEEIRRIVENPPRRPPVDVRCLPGGDYQKDWDGAPRVTCGAAPQGEPR